MLQLFVLKKVAQYLFVTLQFSPSLVRCVNIAQQDKLRVIGTFVPFSETFLDIHCVAYTVEERLNVQLTGLREQQNFKLLRRMLK
jgi:hypothetical protein